MIVFLLNKKSNVGGGSQKYMGADISLYAVLACVVHTAAMEGLLVSPAGGWVTSAPRKMTGSRNTRGL